MPLYCYICGCRSGSHAVSVDDGSRQRIGSVSVEHCSNVLSLGPTMAQNQQGGHEMRNCRTESRGQSSAACVDGLS